MLLTGDALKEFVAQFDKEMDFPIKTVRLGIFDFRSLSIVENPDGFYPLVEPIKGLEEKEE